MTDAYDFFPHDDSCHYWWFIHPFIHLFIYSLIQNVHLQILNQWHFWKKISEISFEELNYSAAFSGLIGDIAAVIVHWPNRTTRIMDLIPNISLSQASRVKHKIQYMWKPCLLIKPVVNNIEFSAWAHASGDGKKLTQKTAL